MEPISPINTPAPSSDGTYKPPLHDSSAQFLSMQPGGGLPLAEAGDHSLSIPSPPVDSNLPFNATYSANISRKAALAIAETLHALPYANPSGLVDKTGLLNIPPSMLPPRTNPTFMCCAIMGAYVLAMLTYKLHEGQLQSPNSDISLALSTYEDALRQGLGRILSGLENYASAFEGIDGMRGVYFLICLKVQFLTI